MKGNLMPKPEPMCHRLHPALDALVRQKAADLETTATWIVEAALAEYFHDDLPPGFAPAKPWERVKHE